MGNFILNSKDKVQAKIELIDALKEIQIATKIMG